MLAKEKEVDVAKADSSGSVGLLWLCRAVELVMESMAGLIRNPQGKMSEIVKEAYHKTLKPHHNVFMNAFFQVRKLRNFLIRKNLQNIYRIIYY